MTRSIGLLLCLSCMLVAQVSDAATMGKGIRGSLTSDQLTYGSQGRAEVNYMYVGIGVAVILVIAGAAAFFMLRKKGAEGDDKAEGEGKVNTVPAEDEAETLAPEVEKKPAADTYHDGPATDYAEMFKLLAQRVAQDVGPSLSKGGAVRNVLHSKMGKFQENFKNLLLTELNGTAGAVLKEMEAEEAMLLLDWNQAVESNFPPISILIAGVLSPTIMNLKAGHHWVQAISVGLPIFILCCVAVYIDQDSRCSIPTIFGWLYTQMVLAFLMMVGHLMMLWKITSGKKRLDAKSEDMAKKIKDAPAGSLTAMREQVVGNLVVLQEALLVENDVRQTIWNKIVGIATCTWVLTTFWNLFLICRYTFVPGVTAFHPAAAGLTGGEYCGSWMTVLVLRISMLLSVLFLFINLATVVQFACDMLIENEGFHSAVLSQSRDMDKKGVGLPVVELLAKAFLLRGGSDTLNSRVAVVGQQRKTLEREKAGIEAKIAALNAEIAAAEKEETALEEQKKLLGGGDIEAQKIDPDEMKGMGEEWKKQGELSVLQAELKAEEIKQATTEKLEEIWEKISAEMEELKERVEASEAYKAADKYAHMAYDKLTDPKFHEELKEYANKAAASAKDAANKAIEYASDPELQKKLTDAANEAMDKAKKAAEDLQKAATDPELRAKLEEAAKEAYDEAQAAAKKVADGVNDPKVQAALEEAHKQALATVDNINQAAIEVANDPKVQEQLAKTGMA